ncbi:MAG: type II secretion system F family protein, partial [Verrucomicrobia bacterium]|nr:type II secretion system F family protein [Verrucomicrobiota bacterium]
MPAFTYEAIVPGGGRKQGTLEARSRQEALAQLSRQRLQPIRLREEGAGEEISGGASRETAVPGDRRMSEAQIISFTEELGDLLDAGLQLEGALRMMEQRSEASSLKAVAESLRTQVREGISLSRALKTASASFSDLYCNLVSAGEVSGALGSILQRQVVYLKKLNDLKGRVVQALIYPMFVTGAGILLMVLFVVVLVPQLKTLFSKSPQSMPLITKLLLWTSAFLVQWGWLVLVLGALGGIAFWQAIQKPEGKLWWDRVRVKIPVAGPVLEASFYAQFSQTLANLLG